MTQEPAGIEIQQEDVIMTQEPAESEVMNQEEEAVITQEAAEIEIQQESKEPYELHQEESEVTIFTHDPEEDQIQPQTDPCPEDRTSLEVSASANLPECPPDIEEDSIQQKPEMNPQVSSASSSDPNFQEVAFEESCPAEENLELPEESNLRDASPLPASFAKSESSKLVEPDEPIQDSPPS
jgi:hypothetical protein